jgi:hypothetical protein
VEIDLDQVPQRGVVPLGAALGCARLAGAHQYLDVVELVEIWATPKNIEGGGNKKNRYDLTKQ